MIVDDLLVIMDEWVTLVLVLKGIKNIPSFGDYNEPSIIPRHPVIPNVRIGV